MKSAITVISRWSFSLRLSTLKLLISLAVLFIACSTRRHHWNLIKTVVIYQTYSWLTGWNIYKPIAHRQMTETTSSKPCLVSCSNYSNLSHLPAEVFRKRVGASIYRSTSSCWHSAKISSLGVVKIGFYHQLAAFINQQLALSHCFCKSVARLSWVGRKKIAIT